eukprot:TRINITY_DN38559_c0_g1_i1.p1 TRINITY_DN38559_c0_g1~~TRINITY_DN38559_c0_g1_i1.p1  ORF type:complete len:571 (-),score=181.35 TRINITY_DN38559_c0_g1_i1:76-1788(-)
MSTKEVHPNFFLWGSWKTRAIKEPFLTKKVAGTLKKIILGETFIIGLKEKGQVVTWGKDSKYGCLGLGVNNRGERVVEAAAPQDVEGMGQVTDIQMGTDHVVALTAAGEVFCWGRGDRGQLGSGDVKNEWRPLKVEALANEQIIQIAVVKNSTFAVSTNGAVFGWGENKDNTLGLGPEEQGIDFTKVPLRLSLLGEMRIRKLEVFEGRTIIAHIASPSNDVFGDFDATAHDDKDESEVEIFRGIDEMQKAMERTQEWWNHLLSIKHGQPYDLPGDSAVGLGDRSGLGTSGSIQDDLNVSLENLKRAEQHLDALLSQALQELKRTAQMPGTRNVRFVLCMFIDECRLRREKVQRTITARQIADLKREKPEINGYSVIDFGADSNEDIKKIIAVQKELQRLHDKVKLIDPVDVLSTELKLTLIECLDNKIMLNDTLVELLKVAEQKDSNPILPPLRIIKDRWNTMKQFSLYSLYMECESKNMEFSSHDEHLQYLVRASNAQIEQMLQIDKDSILSHDTLVPTLCYDLLRENAELRKMANSYQLHVLMLHLGKSISSETVGIGGAQEALANKG